MVISYHLRVKSVEYLPGGMLVMVGKAIRLRRTQSGTVRVVGGNRVSMRRGH